MNKLERNGMSWIRGQQDVPSLHYILTCKQKARTAASRAPLHWQPLSVHIWAHCNPPIAHDMNDVWKVDHTTAETSATLFEQWWGFFYVAFDLTINERMMKETNSTFPPSLIPILTLPAPLSPLTTMDWFLVSRSLLISQNAFCPTANIWGGSSLIDMDKKKINEKYHFMMRDVFVMKANEKKMVKNQRKMELFYMGTDLGGLSCLCL